jgi:hypothetical protein
MEKEVKSYTKIYEELKDHKFFGILVEKASNMQSEKIKTKVFEIIKSLNNSKINILALNKIIFEGLPDDIPSLRSLIWKILLGIIPLDIDKWESTIDKHRNEYYLLKKQYLSKLELDKLNKPVKKKKIIDHPLAISDDSKWKSYFDDMELWEEIDKDIRRTRTNMHFFFMPSKSNSSFITNEEITQLADKKRNEPSSVKTNSFETNADVMCRVLFIYGKKYPKVRYIQGMNEILAPIFYCFSLDQNPYFNTTLEADSFLCFESLMNEI